MAEKTRLVAELESELFDDENEITHTSQEQVRTELSIKKQFELFESIGEYDPELPKLDREKHLKFLRQSLTHLSSSYQSLDSSQPWLCYWITHSLHLLDDTFSSEVIKGVSDFLSRCQNEDGGFGGGPGQYSHLAPTYAAVCALCTLADEISFNVINRGSLLRFLRSVKQPNGAFSMHVDGEVDIRGVYCAVAVARMTNIYSDDLFSNTAEWVASCQTYEGGFSGCPGLEAHGGYTYCGLAALVLLNKTTLCDVKSLLRWCVNRQMRYEGGFQGRANKLIDGCYSFWQGGSFPILHRLLAKDEKFVLDDGRWLFHQEALQEYILNCCQHPNGGCIDKPSKDRDLYHTCYVLSGLSTAQRSMKNVVIGVSENILNPTHPLFNIGNDLMAKVVKHFQNLPVPILLPDHRNLGQKEFNN